MKILILCLGLALSMNVFSSGGKPSNQSVKKCNKLHIDSDDIELKWTGYKFPGAEKKGVSGTLRNLGIKDEYKGASLKEIFTGMKFNIDARSVWSRNSSRDARLVKFFFGKMIGGTFIKGQILSYTEQEMRVKLNMNGLAKEIALKVEQTQERVTARGVIDILNWGMDKSLEAINKECYKLHKGKTWSDVSLQLSLSYRKDC